MTALPARARLAAGIAAAAASAGLPATALASERLDGLDPSLRLHCPSASRVIEAFDAAHGEVGTVRDQVLRMLPYAEPYTRAYMRGRVDVRTSHDGGTGAAVLRGPQHEPIAVYQFVLTGGRWALRSSVQCRSVDPAADRRAVDRGDELTCAGLSWGGIACGGGGAPELPVDRAMVNEVLPEVQVRRSLAQEENSYLSQRYVEPLETTTRFENTWAQVLARDAARNVIATWTFQYEAYGWWAPHTSGCSSVGAEDLAPVA